VRCGPSEEKGMQLAIVHFDKIINEIAEVLVEGGKLIVKGSFSWSKASLFSS